MTLQYPALAGFQENPMQRPSTRTASTLAILVASALAACAKNADAPQPAAAESTPAGENVAAPKPASVKRFMIGELSAVALRDGDIAPPKDNQVFGVGRTPEEVAALLSAAGQPTDKLPLSIQPLLVKRLDKVLLFDTGAGANFGPGAGQLGASLVEAKVDAQNVTDIFLSHVH